MCSSDLAAPDWTAPLVRSGALALEQGESSDAVRWFNALVEAAPDDPLVWMRLATALVADEQADEALAAYRRAVEVRPDYVPALVAVAVQLINLDAHEEADRKSTRLNSSHVVSSYAGFCLKKK